MNKILGYLKQHFIVDGVRWQAHIRLLLFLIPCFIFNYLSIFDGSFEDHVIDVQLNSMARFCYYCSWYILAYFGACLAIGVGKWRDYRFYLFPLLAIIIQSFDAVFNPNEWVYHAVTGSISEKIMSYKISSQLSSIFTTFLPILAIWLLFKNGVAKRYGLRLKGSELKPYLFMIVVMLPLIAWASTQQDFLETYPIFNRGLAGRKLENFYAWLMGFELAYGWGFVMVELLFRGFLVLGVVHILGREAILPMVSFYAFIHFGKPLGEAIGSIFGGYILGVVAYYSRNIIGGIIAHLGVAWGMELGAFIQLWWRSNGD